MENRLENKFCNACDDFFRCIGGLEVDCPLNYMKTRAKMKKSVSVGQKIMLRLHMACSSYFSDCKVKCTVFECYDKFCVLTNGKYRFCAYYEELYDGALITV